MYQFFQYEEMPSSLKAKVPSYFCPLCGKVAFHGEVAERTNNGLWMLEIICQTEGCLWQNKVIRFHEVPYLIVGKEYADYKAAWENLFQVRLPDPHDEERKL